MTQYSNSHGGSTQIQTANQQQIGQPKLGGKKCVSDTTINQKMQWFLHRSKNANTKMQPDSRAAILDNRAKMMYIR
jgi:hypothetical protein